MATRKVSEVSNGLFRAVVRRDAEWDAWIVRFYRDGEHMKNADYHADSKADAQSTAAYEVERLEGDRQRFAYSGLIEAANASGIEDVMHFVDSARCNAEDTVWIEKAAKATEWGALAFASLRTLLDCEPVSQAAADWFNAHGIEARASEPEAKTLYVINAPIGAAYGPFDDEFIAHEWAGEIGMLEPVTDSNPRGLPVYAPSASFLEMAQQVKTEMVSQAAARGVTLDTHCQDVATGKWSAVADPFGAFTRDYTLTMQDSAGRTFELGIIGASIDEMIASGYSRADAIENVEANAFQNAIARNDIGADAWLVSTPAVADPVRVLERSTSSGATHYYSALAVRPYADPVRVTKPFGAFRVTFEDFHYVPACEGDSFDLFAQNLCCPYDIDR